MAIKKQTIELTIIFDEESTYEGSAVEAIFKRLFEEDGLIEMEYQITKEEILPDEDFMYDDLED